MDFASSLFCSSKFREHTHTLTKRLTVLACSDNNKDVRTPSVFVFFFCWAQFFAPPSEWRPRRPPIPPVGKTAPGRRHLDHHGNMKRTISSLAMVVVVFVVCFLPSKVFQVLIWVQVGSQRESVD